MFALFTHVPESFVGRYVDAGTPRGVVRLPLLGSGYTDWAKAHPLAEVLRGHGWDGSQRVVLVGWSAGVFPIRQWLRAPENRALVAGALLLDGLHSAGPPCQADAVAPLVAYAQTGKPLAVTASLIVPGSYASAKDCLDLLRSSLPPSAQVELVQATDSDHVAQVRDVGPRLFRQWLVPRLGSGGSSAWPWLLAAAAGVATGAFGGWWAATRAR